MNTNHLQRLAGLTQLSLTPLEEEQLLAQLTASVAASENLLELEANPAQPLVYPFNATQTPRADVVTETDVSEQAFKLAPAVEDKHFLVPQVVE